MNYFHATLFGVKTLVPRLAKAAIYMCNRIREGGGGQGEQLGVGVASSITGQVMRPQAGRREGREVGQPGKYIPFVGNTSGGGQKGETGKLSKANCGLYIHQSGTNSGGRCSSNTTPPPLHFLVITYQMHGPNVVISQVSGS